MYNNHVIYRSLCPPYLYTHMWPVSRHYSWQCHWKTCHIGLSTETLESFHEVIFWHVTDWDQYQESLPIRSLTWSELYSLLWSPHLDKKKVVLRQCGKKFRLISLTSFYFVVKNRLFGSSCDSERNEMRSNVKFISCKLDRLYSNRITDFVLLLSKPKLSTYLHNIQFLHQGFSEFWCNQQLRTALNCKFHYYLFRGLHIDLYRYVMNILVYSPTEKFYYCPQTNFVAR